MISNMGQDTFVLSASIEKNITLDFVKKDFNNQNLELLIHDLGLEKLSNKLTILC